MSDKFFLNGKAITAIHYKQTAIRVISSFYWGLSNSRVSRLLIILGYIPYISFTKLLKKEKTLRKRFFFVTADYKETLFF